MILKAGFMTSSEELFKNLNWLSFLQWVPYHTCLMVYKSMTGQAPEYITSVLTYVADHHERQTRSTPKLNCIFLGHTQLTLICHFQFKVRHYGIAYQRILRIARLSISLNVICSIVPKTRSRRP